MKKIIVNMFCILIALICILVICTYQFYPIKYKDEIIKCANKYELDPYLIFAIIKTESGFNEKASSVKDARGLMQIRQITVDWAGQELDIAHLNKEDHYDPEINIEIGCWNLKKLFSIYPDNLDKVLAAYNAGIGNVNKWIEEGKMDAIPFKETKNYITKVKRNLKIYQLLY